MRGTFGPTPFLLPVPVGETCAHCDEAFSAEDFGINMNVPMHQDCFLRATQGGANHIAGTCSCCGGNQPPDPPGLTKREAARLARKQWMERETRRAIR